jgi:hypothetical protein
MTQYAYYDPTVGPPSPVIGWYDTSAFMYPNMPPITRLLAVSQAQWAARMTGQWAVNNRSLVAYTPPSPPPSPAQQALVLLAAGLTITSLSTPSITGLYACDGVTQSHVQAELWSIILNGTFADGSMSVAWPDAATGQNHIFPDTITFRAFATAIGSFVAGCAKVINGSSVLLPPSAATIL